MRTVRNDLHSVEFFDLQLRFAERVAALTDASLAETVGTHTNLYVRLGMGHELDAANPDWRAYVAALLRSNDPAAFTHAVHRERIDRPIGPEQWVSVGCFSCAPVEPGCVRLHFHARGEPDGSPLASANHRRRKIELAALLSELRASAGDELWVVGASWLYNLPSYRRLFPQPYLASLRAVEPPYQRLPLWGQLLDSDRRVRREVAGRFLARIALASNLSELGACFPLQVLATKAPAMWLYRHVGLQAAGRSEFSSHPVGGHDDGHDT